MHTLLLADDSVTIQRVIELTFAEEDIEVVAVSDGDQAIDRLEADPPDIVLADIGMPGRDGYEVARYVRQSARLAHIPVVLLTGAFEPVDQAKAAEVDCDGVLAKPFEPQLVIGRVKELLSRKSRKSADAEAAVAAAPLVPQPAPPIPFAPAAETAVPVEPAVPKDLDDYFDRLDDAFATLPGQAPAAKVSPIEPRTSNAGTSVADQIDWYASQQAPAASPELAPEFETSGGAPLSFDLPEASAPEALHVAAPAAPTPAPSGAEAFAPDIAEAFAPSVAETLAPSAAEASALSVTEASAPSTIEEPAPSVGEALVPTANVDAPVAKEVEAPGALATAVPFAARTLPSVADAFAAILAAEQTGSPAARPVWPTPPAPGQPAQAPELSEAVLEQLTQRVLTRLSDRVVHDTVADVAERLVREEIERIKASIR